MNIKLVKYDAHVRFYTIPLVQYNTMMELSYLELLQYIRTFLRQKFSADNILSQYDMTIIHVDYQSDKFRLLVLLYVPQTNKLVYTYLSALPRRTN